MGTIIQLIINLPFTMEEFELNSLYVKINLILKKLEVEKTDFALHDCQIIANSVEISKNLLRKIDRIKKLSKMMSFKELKRINGFFEYHNMVVDKLKSINQAQTIPLNLIK